MEYDWAINDNGNKYGLLADILGGDEYEETTGIAANDYDPSLAKPGAYDEDITSRTTDHARERMTAERNEEIRWWYKRRGLHRGLRENLQDALDSTYYEQLEDDITGYETVTPKQFLEHLRNIWCRLDTAAIQEMKDEYYANWDPNMHITKYINSLQKGQKQLARDNIIINNEDKLHHFILQMYKANMFDKEDIKKWERIPANEKTWDSATAYFANLVREQEMFDKLSGNSTKKAKYDSAAMAMEKEQQDNALATLGDEVREYMAKIAGAKEDNTEQLMKLQQTNKTMAESTASLQRQLTTKDEQITALTAQVATLTATITQLTKAMQCFPVEAQSADQKGNTTTKRKRDGWQGGPGKRNMGGYCHSHGFDPIGFNHDSKTCKFPRKNHKKEATVDNTMGGNLEQPKKEKVHPNQQAQWVNRA